MLIFSLSFCSVQLLPIYLVTNTKKYMIKWIEVNALKKQTLGKATLLSGLE